MDGATRNELAVSRQGSVKIGDTTFLVSQPTDQDMGTLLAWVRKRQRDPLTMLGESLDGVPAKYHKEVIKATVEVKHAGGAMPSDAFIHDQLSTPEGTAFLAWLLVRKAHPDATLESLSKVITAANAPDILAELYDQSGMKAAAEGKAVGQPT